MTLTIETCAAEFDRALKAYHDLAHVEEEAGLAALRLLAAHALSVAPDATHMLMESSDQGDYMTVPMYLNKDGENIAEAEWDAHVEEHEDDLHPVASYLDWSRSSENGWETFADTNHSYSATKNGYYAMDLRRIAESVTPEPTVTITLTRHEASSLTSSFDSAQSGREDFEVLAADPFNGYTEEDIAEVHGWHEREVEIETTIRAAVEAAFGS